MTEQIMIRDHCWYQKEISPIQWQNGLDGKSAFQYEGTYLLVGMGGINQVIGTYLAANYRASIIYVSKSELNEERSLQLEKIQELGGKASYLKTDITIASEVKIRVTIISSKPTIAGTIKTRVFSSGLYHARVSACTVGSDNFIPLFC